MLKIGLHDLFGHLQHKLWKKRKDGGQIDNLTPDHKKLRIDLTFMRANGVQYTVGKLSMRTTTLL